MRDTASNRLVVGLAWICSSVITFVRPRPGADDTPSEGPHAASAVIIIAAAATRCIFIHIASSKARSRSGPALTFALIIPRNLRFRTSALSPADGTPPPIHRVHLGSSNHD